MVNTFMNAVSCGGVTLFQCSPPSAVVWITPSSVPIQMRLMSTIRRPDRVDHLRADRAALAPLDA